MLFLAAAALATPSAMPATPRFSTVAQATATIRVVTGVRLKLDGSVNPDAPAARDSAIKSADGPSQPAKLIEFQ